MWLLWIGIIVLMAANIFFCGTAVKKLQNINIMRKGLTRAERSTIEIINSRFVKKNLIEKAEIYFIYRTNIQKYVPFFNIYFLMAFMLLLFFILYFVVIKLVLFPPTTVVLAGLLACTPLLILEIMNRYQETQIRKSLGSFISCVGRWLTVKEDLYYAFEKASLMIKQPIKQYVKDFLIQIRMGSDAQEALDLLGARVDNDFFSDFLVNIKGNIKARGDLKDLFFVLEKQFYKLEKEIDRRKINNVSDKLVLYVIVAVTLGLCLYMLCMVPSTRIFYTQTELGRMLLLIFSVLFVAGTVLFGKFTGVKL